jgi:DNA (cytosine-5)-methyltransferase 1
MGYSRAGFEVVGVDIEPQPHYPFEFHQADALTFPLEDFDAVHASPPCQAYGPLRHFPSNRGREYPRLIEPIRDRLLGWGGIYVIENVVGAPLIHPVRLCGSSFGRPRRRHRLFEANVALLVPPCAHRQLPRTVNVAFGSASIRQALRQGRQDIRTRYVAVYGNTHAKGEQEARKMAMGIDWMNVKELSQAIPPDYTELIGRQLLTAIARPAA